MKKKFIDIFSEAFAQNLFVKMTISSVVKDNAETNDLKSIFLKPFDSKSGRVLSWVFRHQRKDITKNYTLQESVNLLEKYLGNLFSQADLFCLGNDYFLKTDGKEKLTQKANTVQREIKAEHNKSKNRMVDENAHFLQLLGVTSKDGYLKKDKKDKFIQINKFLEFFSNATSSLNQDEISVLDMGSGKGYLTFAVYNFLQQTKKARVTGVEFRQDMVKLCNNLAKEARFSGLSFEQGTIADYNFENNDVLIALHACDTATDEALFKGINSGSKVIMVSPCCHKQVRKSMKIQGVVSAFSKYGILEERTAEMLTDMIRAAILEIYGYQTQIFEFVNAENSPKNLMITAIKKIESKANNPESWKDVEELKKHFGIAYHHLQKMLDESNK